MTRKDYQAIAKVFSDLRQDDAPVDWVTIGTVEEKLADMFVTANPKFDPARFYVACVGAKRAS